MPIPGVIQLDGFTPDSIGRDAFQTDAAIAHILGNRLKRTAANLPQTAQGGLFTVSGGEILVTQIYGKVTTVIQTQADSIKLIANPTVGTDVDLCAALNISAKAVNTLLSITGVVGDAMIGAGLSQRGMNVPLIVPAGTIDLDATASNTGQIEWTLFWIPLHPDAAVVVV